MFLKMSSRYLFIVILCSFSIIFAQEEASLNSNNSAEQAPKSQIISVGNFYVPEGFQYIEKDLEPVEDSSNQFLEQIKKSAFKKITTELSPELMVQKNGGLLVLTGEGEVDTGNAKGYCEVGNPGYIGYYGDWFIGDEHYAFIFDPNTCTSCHNFCLKSATNAIYVTASSCTLAIYVYLYSSTGGSCPTPNAVVCGGYYGTINLTAGGWIITWNIPSGSCCFATQSGVKYFIDIYYVGDPCGSEIYVKDGGSSCTTYNNWGSGWYDLYNQIGYNLTQYGTLACCINPTITANPPSATACQGSAVYLTAPSGYASYTWYGPGTGTGNVRTVTSSGACWVVCTDSDGCPGTSNTINVTINPTPSCAITSANTVCANSTGNTASVPSAGGGATYNWSIGNGTITGGQGTNSITYTAGGSGTLTLMVSVTNSYGCSCNNSKDVGINPTPVCTITTASSVCAGSTGNTASVPSAGSGASYNWSITNGTITGGQGTNTITYTAGSAGSLTISVVITNSYGCTCNNSTNVTVKPNPSCTISTVSSVCSGGTGYTASVPDAGTGAIYTWGITNGTITSGQGTRSITYSAGTSGTLTLSISILAGNGCSCNNSLNIPIKPLPDCTISYSSQVCAYSTGNTASVGNAGPGATYLWGIINGTITSGQYTTTITYTAGAPGTCRIDVQITDGNGCTCSKYVNVQVRAPSCTITAPDSVCPNTEGYTASVPDAGGGATYNWSIINGTITSGQGTRNITFTSGASGTITLSISITDSYGCSCQQTKYIDINPIPDCTISTVEYVCPGGSGYQASVPDAGSGASYSWSISNGTITGGQGTRTITYSAGNSGKVTLYISITDGNGCICNNNREVTIRNNPSCTITAESQVCPGSSGHNASVPDAGPGSSYNWSITNGTINSGQGTRSITFTAGNSGTVILSISITDGYGCTCSDSKNITIRTNPSCTITAESEVCPDSSGHIASVPDAGPGSTYNWGITNGTINSGQGTRTITYTAGSSGVVSLSISIVDGYGCTCSDSKNVNIRTRPSCTISTVSQVCPGSSGHIASAPDAGPGASYDWSITNGSITSGQGTKSITYTAGNSGVVNISVTITDSYGCVCTDSVDVNIRTNPSCTITSESTVCSGSEGHIASVPDAGPGSTYNWNITNGTITAGQGTHTIVYSAGTSGTLTLFVSITDGYGCSCSDSKNISIRSGPDCTITAEEQVCPNSSGHIASVPNAGQGASYNWIVINGELTSGQGTNTITYTAGGGGILTLFITIIDGYGCPCVGYFDVIIRPNPSCEISAESDVCAGTGGHIASVPDAGEGASYNWSITNGIITAGQGTNSITYTAGNSGIISLSVAISDAYGCACTGNKEVIIRNNPTCTITASSSVCAESTGNIASVPDAGPGSSYNWSINNGTITAGQGTNTITYTAGSAGSLTLSVSITNVYGCNCSDNRQVTVNPKPVCTITAESQVCGGTAGHIASVPDAGPGANYNWNISNGTITSGQGTNSITYTAGNSGTLTLSVSVINSYGCSCTGNKMVNIVEKPSCNISAESYVCPESANHNASVPDAGPDASYTWETTNGTITSGQGTRTITYTAGSSGIITLSVSITDAYGCSCQGSKEIPIRTNPSCIITAPDKVCAGTDGHSASVPDAGEGASYSWQITNGTINSGQGSRSITFTAGNSGTLTLSISITDGYGCSCQGNKDIEIKPNPQCYIATESEVCAGTGGHTASVDNAGPGATYNWSITNGTITSGQGTNSITYTAGNPGTLTLSVAIIDGNGCACNNNVEVYVYGNPSCTITAESSVCAGTGGHLASVPDAGVGASYYWNITNGVINSGQGTNSITYTAGNSGTLVLDITIIDERDCTCNGSKNVQIRENPNCTITAASVVCAGTGGHTASVPNAGAGATYNWSITNGTITAGQGTSTITYTAGTAGILTLNISISNAYECVCNGQKEVQVKANPLCAISTLSPVCEGSTGNVASVPDAGPNANYFWGITNGNITSGQGTRSITYQAGIAGITRLNINIVDQYGCSCNGFNDVTVIARPVCTITAPSTLCAGSTGYQASVPQAGGDVTYNWSITNGTITSGQGTNKITFAAGNPGELTLSISITTPSNCNCENSINIPVYSAPVCIISAEAEVCERSVGHLASVPDTGPGTSYQWSIINGIITAGQGSRTITYTAGSYGNIILKVIVSNAQGCKCNGTFEVISLQGPTADAGPDIIMYGNTATLRGRPSTTGTPPFLYQWSGPGNIIGGDTLTPTVDQPGIYTLLVRDANGCNDTDQAEVIKGEPKAVPTVNWLGLVILISIISWYILKLYRKSEL